MEIPNLIYCTHRNKRYSQIAIDNGYLFGARLPSKNHFPLYFADQDFKLPNRERYINAVRKEKPNMATVLDLDNPDKFNEVMDWAEEIAEHVQDIIIIPKCDDVIRKIPYQIYGKRVVLGYSVPTSYGRSAIPIDCFNGREVHLLGGSPMTQMDIFVKASGLKIISADGNYLSYISKFGAYLDRFGRQRYITKECDAIYTAFKLSCENTMKLWNGLDGNQLSLF